MLAVLDANSRRRASCTPKRASCSSRPRRGCARRSSSSQPAYEPRARSSSRKRCRSTARSAPFSSSSAARRFAPRSPDGRPSSRAQGRHGRLLRPRRLHERAESLDPEDVEAILRPYHERVRAELERHGGTVEKFIGDAVMALFGAPTAHEDDPERAVRAALAIRDFAVEEGLELRVGITTGEALVALDASPTPARAWPRATSSTLPRACRAARRSTGSSSTTRPIARRGSRRVRRGRRRSRRREVDTDRRSAWSRPCSLRGGRRSRGTGGARRPRA